MRYFTKGIHYTTAALISQIGDVPKATHVNRLLNSPTIKRRACKNGTEEMLLNQWHNRFHSTFSWVKCHVDEGDNSVEPLSRVFQILFSMIRLVAGE